MAIKKVQKNRLNENNEFDVIHYETEASVVLMEDGTTAEAAINAKQSRLKFDETPTAGSTNPVTSGGVATYVEEKIEAIPTPDVSGQINTHNSSEDAHANLLKDMVTATGGAVMSIEDVFGEGPYTIEFIDDEGTDFDATCVPYDNTVSGLAATNMQAAIDELVTEKADGSALPEVTSADNGKFLRVVDGIWAVATIANAEEASF